MQAVTVGSEQRSEQVRETKFHFQDAGLGLWTLELARHPENTGSRFILFPCGRGRETEWCGRDVSWLLQYDFLLLFPSPITTVKGAKDRLNYLKYISLWSISIFFSSVRIKMSPPHSLLSRNFLNMKSLLNIVQQRHLWQNPYSTRSHVFLFLHTEAE